MGICNLDLLKLLVLTGMCESHEHTYKNYSLFSRNVLIGKQIKQVKKQTQDSSRGIQCSMDTSIEVAYIINTWEKSKRVLEIRR